MKIQSFWRLHWLKNQRMDASRMQVPLFLQPSHRALTFFQSRNHDAQH